MLWELGVAGALLEERRFVVHERCIEASLKDCDMGGHASVMDASVIEASAAGHGSFEQTRFIAAP